MQAIKATLTEKVATSGYGERLTIAIQAPTPKFRNLGWNCWRCAQLQLIELDKFPAMNHPSNTAPEWSRDEGKFSGTVRAEFADGGSTWIHIYPADAAYSADAKRYTRPLFTVQG